ncbi:MAG: hypothetical protein V3V33_12535 [Candidatus Lokiarchaeia archaeon]
MTVFTGNPAILDFALEYIKEHTYITSRKMALVYGKCVKTEKPSGSLVRHFGRIMGQFKKEGLIEKFNSHQYKKVKKVDNNTKELYRIYKLNRMKAERDEMDGLHIPTIIPTKIKN